MERKTRFSISISFAGIVAIFGLIFWDDPGLGSGVEFFPATILGSFIAAYKLLPKIGKHVITTKSHLTGIVTGFVVTLFAYLIGSISYVVICSIVALPSEDSLFSLFYLTLVLALFAPFMGFNYLVTAIPAGISIGWMFYIIVTKNSLLKQKIT